MSLIEEHCEALAAGTPPLTPEQAAGLAQQTPAWALAEASITREFQFTSFRRAIEFVRRLAELAEAENHHPDIHIYYNRVQLELSSHRIGGLTRNDFILAAKIDRLVEA